VSPDVVVIHKSSGVTLKVLRNTTSINLMVINWKLAIPGVTYAVLADLKVIN
jgi:hypothetical protein